MEQIAIDLGGRESQICVRASTGEILEEKRWPTPALGEYLARRAPSRVVLETSSEAFAVADLARQHSHEVRVVPSIYVRALGVGARGVKNDRNDARALSEASCKMEVPSVHVPSATARELRATCTSRDAQMGTRTKLINTVRSWMRTQLITMRRGGPEAFSRKVRERLQREPTGVPSHIERTLRTIEFVTSQLKEADRELNHLVGANEVCRRLMTVPGVGPVTAARFVAAVDEVGRFSNAHQLESYFGLTPGQNVTGFVGHNTHLTKAGSSAVRWTLVQASWTAIRCCPTHPMVRWSQQVAARRGKAIAAVGLARKIAGILYAIWRDATTYDPKRGGQPLEEMNP
jgi:transposase